jgi:hypothetical protein
VGGRHIPAQTPLRPTEVVFCFKHLHLCDKFTPAGRDGQYVLKLLQRMQALCRTTRRELVANKSTALRCHLIAWDRTTEPEGFNNLPAQLEDVEPWQFEVSANEHGRVHGFFIGDVFHVVWVDPDHKLYP